MTNKPNNAQCQNWTLEIEDWDLIRLIRSIRAIRNYKSFR